MLEVWEEVEMIQQTSIDAFRQIKKDGTLGNKQRVVFEAFKKYGAVTNLEIATWEKIPINQVTPRTNELVKMGYVAESHKRKCSISGRTAIAWRISYG